MNKGLLKIGASTVLGGGLGLNGTPTYLSDMARRALGLAYSTNKDGQVQYFSRNKDTIKRAIIQTVSQTAYGLLRSYPRYIRYYENKARGRQLMTSNTALANKNGEYYKLMQEQYGGYVDMNSTDSFTEKILIDKKNKLNSEKYQRDAIVGRVVPDFLQLSVSKSDFEKTHLATEKSFKDIFSTSIDQTQVKFIDLHGMVQISSKNNIVTTTVQGRDYSRKEFISGGDLEITINGKITSKYPDIYPESDVSKFIKLMQYKGVIKCDHTILRQFNVSQLIVQSYSLPSPENARNIQNYSFSCVAVEPDTPVELKLAAQEIAEEAIAVNNATAKWIKLARFGTQVMEPTVLLNLTRTWL